MRSELGFDKDLVRLLVLVLVVFGGWCLGVLEQVVFFFLRVFFFLFFFVVLDIGGLNGGLGEEKNEG